MKKISAVILLVLLLFLSGCGQGSNQNQSTSSTATSNKEKENLQQTSGAAPLRVHFLDVGQADSILVQLPNGQSMLVDAGNNSDGPFVVSYLKQQGIKRIEYLVGTHPHADHLGGLDNVINDFDIGKVYLPKTTTTTKTFEDVLLALKNKNLKISPARAGVAVIEQDNLKINLVAPVGSGYKELNNYSAVIRIQYGDTAFLLTGDAQAESESEMLKAGGNLKADVLKVGHHGSRSSTTTPFLKAAAPKYAVIKVGAGNDYGHPHKETLERLAGAGITLYRTDLDGTLIFGSDGKNITVEKAAGKRKPRVP